MKMKGKAKANGHADAADLRELPPGWMWVRLEDLASPEPRSITDGPFGSNLKSEHYTDAGPRVIRLENIGHGLFIDKPAHISEKHYRRLERHAVTGGDLVIAILGSPLPRACIVPASLGAAIVKADCIRFKPDTALVDHRFACWWINSKEPQKAAEEAIHGVGRPRLGMQNVKDLMVPLAPRPEQDRIVAKLDELLSDIEAGEKSLERAALLVKRYRQSVLKAAVTGELSKDWRAKNLPRLKREKKTGADLLADILATRRAAWEAAELAKMIAKGKAPKDDKWKKKYVEPAAPKMDDLAELPDGWVWARLEQLSSLVTSGSRGWKEYYADEGALFIRAQNLNRDRLDLTRKAFVKLPLDAEGTRTRVRSSDVLITITGANVTKTGIVESELEEAYVSQHVALLRPALPELSHYAYLWLLSSPGGRSQLEKAAYGAGKPGLNLENINDVVVALPSLDEQQQILSNASAVFSIADAAQLEVRRAGRRAATLRQSLLSAAFSGKLVPQDLADETASILLQRIKAGREGPAPIKQQASPTAAGPMATQRRRRKKAPESGDAQGKLL